ncbi:sensor domain-containing diguanylate cyclase [Radicibacter daui]|uniref:sensor domain-containing diguanylate cyclase n=1 Tax=Radicibacter daui TaxID=3064829 RepID=UPI004046BA48
MTLIRTKRLSLLLTGLLALSVALVGVTAYVLHDDLRQAESEAGTENLNLARAIGSELGRTAELYDLALQDTMEALQQPAIANLDPETRRFVLFGRSTTQPYLGSMFLIDPAGNFLDIGTGESTRNVNIADRDYFTAQRDHKDTGLYLSHPFFSRLRQGEPSIAFSRRLPDRDGAFSGIVAGVLRMSYFRDLVAAPRLSEGSVITILSADGTILMREPSIDGAGDVGRRMQMDPALQNAFSQKEGTVTGKSPVDGIRRVFALTRIKEAPIIVSVGQSISAIHARWWQRIRLLACIGALLAAGAFALSLLLQREFRRRMIIEKQLMALSRVDALTGLANRRAFDACVAQEWARAQRTRQPLSVLMIDLDGFKGYNDRLGHMEGDRLLAAVGRLIASRARRPADLAARFGGDEFALILPETPAAAAEAVARSLREEIEALYGSETESNPSRVTLSVGLATDLAAAGHDVGVLISAADAALYQSKRGGRNQVTVAPPGRQAPPSGAVMSAA